MLTAPGIPPHRLDLKINCICAMKRNLSAEKELVRNSRVRIIALHRRLVDRSKSNCSTISKTTAFHISRFPSILIDLSLKLEIQFVVEGCCHDMCIVIIYKTTVPSTDPLFNFQPSAASSF
ncbi:hypothetical protein EV424DRAFT_404914 [Suillus variegatus]|nr:hypothetical protein EV424DRAFT_404914 [Suillus variegatus]